MPQGPAQLRDFEKAIDLQIKSLKDTGKPLTKEASDALSTSLNASFASLFGPSHI